MVPTSTEEAARPAETAEVDTIARQSLREWAKTVFGAPRCMDEIATLLKQEEEVFVRVATEIQRREIVEQRGSAPAAAQRRPAAPLFFDLRTMDPWSISLHELKTSTEKIEVCAACNGTQSNACKACEGSGLEVVWLTYTQQARIAVTLFPDNGASARYPELAEKKILARADLTPFVVHTAALSSGAIAGGALALDDFERLQKHRPRIDTRIERASQQQYVHFGATRRELSYEMAGLRGKIALSGARCVVELGPDSLKPIRMRLALWAGGGIVSVLFMALAFVAVRGPTEYSRGSNALLALLFVAATAALIGTIGAGLRVIGVRFRLQRPTALELFHPAVLLVVLAAMLIVKEAARPSSAEARRAIATGDTVRAAMVIDALEATETDSSETSTLRDELAIIEAQKLNGDARLARLDELASQGGTRAAEASKLSREERLTRVRALVASKKLTDALELTERVFTGADRELPEVQEARASVHEAEYAQCGADACRYSAAQKAERANATRERAARTRDLRTKLMDVLATADVRGETTLARLQRAKLLEASAKSIANLAGDDGELRDRARGAEAWARAARASVPLLGADVHVIEELIGKLDDTDGKLRIVIEEAAVYVAMDKKKGGCTGLYVVGESKETRQRGLKGEHLLSLVLSKALGHTVLLKKPSAQSASSKDPGAVSWIDGGVLIVARWHDGAFVELRIGDANPGAAPVAPRPPAPGKALLVTFIAFPGGQILVDGVLQGRDATMPIRLRAGKHEARVKNRFLGESVHPFEAREGQNDSVVIVW